MSAFASSKKCLLLLTLCIALPSVAAFADSRSIEVSPSFLFFRQTGTATLPAQQIKVESEASVAVALTASATTKTGGPWLSVSPLAATGSAKFNVSVNTTGLSAGEYAGSISIGVAGIPTPLVVGVLLEVISSTPAAIVLRPQELEFSAVAGGSAPPAQTISVTTSAAVTSWTAAATVSSPTGGSWLKVSPATGTTSGTLQVTVDPTGLAKGEYQGKVTVSGGGFSASASVELEVSAAAPSKLVVVPAAIVFNFDSDDNVTVLQRTMSIRNAGSGTLNWTAKAIVDTPSGGTWLSIGTSSGTTPSSVTVSANSSGLSPGTYNGRIMVTSGSDSAEARVYFMIHGPDKPRVVVHPRAIHFAESGTTITPASRNISVTSKQTGLSFTATATTAKGGNWLKVSPTSGAVTTSSFVTASVDGTIAGALAPGVYTGQIEIKTPGASKATHDVFVALRVFGAQEGVELEVEPGGLGFKEIPGGAHPVSQHVSR